MTQLTQAQKRVALDAIAATDPTLADAIAERLDQDPTAAAIDRMTEGMMGELHAFRGQMIGELHTFRGEMVGELRPFRWQMLLIVALSMILNTAIVGVGTIVKYGSAEITVAPAIPTNGVMVEDVRLGEPRPAPLARHLW